MEKKSQLERIRGRLHEIGYITRNQCLQNRITRLGARICDLEKQGYVFDARWQGGDYVYRLVSINGVPFDRQRRRDQIIRDNAEAIRFFDNYQSS